MVREMNCSFSSYKRSTSLLLLQACVHRHLETPLAQRNCYGAEAEGKFLGLNLVRMNLTYNETQQLPMNVSSERKEKVQIEIDQLCVKTRDLRPQFNV